MPESRFLSQSMNWIRLFLALALWPGVWATGRCFAGLLRSAAATPTFPWWAASCFGAGWAAAGLAYLYLPKPRDLYVLGHELTHALAVWLSGGKVHSLQVGGKGGRVVSDRTSAWITLAPYILPLYPFLAGILWLAGLQAWPRLIDFHLPFLAIWGAVWGYHYAFTLDLLRTRQPDFLVYGRIFSLTVIALSNLLLATGLIWSFFRPIPFSLLITELGRNWVWVYTQGVHSISGLLLRYLPPPA
ncbi:MAG: hypothetical protein EBZ83_00705 [Verrucomicrobia bacterium]|nr:hypothetical protein [Verrucomicrobiota bacterium]NBU68154.1 hypothetical protein [Verrucomicrobiota bacterium]NDB99934.1 hypothetical protein [Verrucomicrobiota bacterium]NDF16486.1 hypothetical protein [Verrucomicrobiota bacterium]